MVAQEDSWWWVAVGVLIGLLIMAALMPVDLIKPAVTATARLAASPEEAEIALTAQAPGVTLPIVAVLAGLFLAGLSAWKIYDEQQSSSRWTWMLVAAGITLLWAILMLQMTIKIGARLVGTG